MILEIKDLNVTFQTRSAEVKAVNGVSLNLFKGDRLGIVGESGCGKSTLAYSILQLLAANATTSGEIIYKGKNLLSLDRQELDEIRWQEISMVFQNSMTALNPVTKIGNQIMDALLEHQEVPKEEAKKRAEGIIEKVGIPKERLFEYPHEYSGGMKQRAVLALALICHPSIVIADEPTTALDVVAQRQVLQLLLELQNEMGLTLIMISHDISAISEICNKIAVMYAGQIMEYGTTRQVFRQSKHPYTKALVNSFPSLHRPLRELQQIRGTTPSLSDLPPGCPFAPRCDFARPICREQNPEIRELSDGALCKCHFAEEVIQ